MRYTKSTIRLYLDQDGVIADFDQHFENHIGMIPRQYEDTYGTGKFWAAVVSVPNFWINIPPFPYLEEMWNFITSNFEHVMILSSPSDSDYERTVKEKRLWLDKHLKMPDGSHVPAIFRKEKHVYADPNSILIDDYHKKIVKWKDAGGIVIHHKTWETTKEQLLKLLGK